MTDTLRGALDTLRTDGWLQSNLGAPGGPRCAVGALIGAHELCVASRLRSSTPLDLDLERLAAVVLSEWPERVSSFRQAEGAWAIVVGWNNHPDTDLSDVEVAFEKAIAS